MLFFYKDCSFFIKLIELFLKFVVFCKLIVVVAVKVVPFTIKSGKRINFCLVFG